MGNLCIKIPGWAVSQSQVLLHLFEKHFNRPSRGVNFHHRQKGQRRVGGQKYAPLFLVWESAQVQFDVADAFILHHDFKIARVEFPATLRVARLF